MELRLSVMARDRQFAKAMRRVRQRIQPLLDAFADVQMLNPIHKAILVGVTTTNLPRTFARLQTMTGSFKSCLALNMPDLMMV